MPTEQTDTTQTPPEEITYTPTVWADGADGGTPINAANLNNMEEAIMALVERTTKQVVTSMIADGAVTNAKLDQTLRDSLSLTSASSDVVQFNLTNERRIRFALYDAPDDGSTGPYLAVNVMSRGEWQTMKRIATW